MTVWCLFPVPVACKRLTTGNQVNNKQISCHERDFFTHFRISSSQFEMKMLTTDFKLFWLSICLFVPLIQRSKRDILGIIFLFVHSHMLCVFVRMTPGGYYNKYIQQYDPMEKYGKLFVNQPQYFYKWNKFYGTQSHFWKQVHYETKYLL